MNEKPKIIIDTDPGHDDALAIMLLVKSNLFDIQAITTVAGNVDIQNTTNNARYILDLLGCDIPIFSGAKKPLKRSPVRANVHGKSGLDGSSVTKSVRLNNLATKKIAEIVRSSSGETSILVLGPQTNLAEAFLKDPGLPKLIKKLVIMGGAISVPGNKSAVAEFNIFSDPEAAKIVFDADVEKVLIPLDVCNEVHLFIHVFKKIDGTLKAPILKMMRKYIKGIEKFENFKGALVYDALAAYYFIRPGDFKTRSIEINVETQGENTYGMTVADLRSWGKQQPNTNLVTQIDREAFVKEFTRILSKKDALTES